VGKVFSVTDVRLLIREVAVEHYDLFEDDPILRLSQRDLDDIVLRVSGGELPKELDESWLMARIHAEVEFLAKERWKMDSRKARA